MKKALSILVVLALVGTCCFGSISAVVAADESGLVFDLNLENYDASSQDPAKGITDNQENSTIEVTGTPELMVNDTLAGTPRKTLKIATGQSNTDRGIKVTNPQIINQDELSIEIWAYADAPGFYDRLYAITDDNAQEGENKEVRFSTEVMMGESNIYYRVGRPKQDYAHNEWINNNPKHPEVYDTWTHYVFTRKWDSANSKWIYSTYLNGQKTSDSLTGEASGVKIDETGKYLYIANGKGDQGLRGSIGSFKVYNQVLDDAKIQSDYAAEKDSFVLLSNTLEVETTTPAADGLLDMNASKINIRFNNYLDASTIAGNIALVNAADDTPIKGGSYITWDTTQEFVNEVSLQYGKLEANTAYKLKINSALCSINGHSYSGGDLSFTSNNGVLYEEDFSGEEWVVDAPAPFDAGLQLTSQGKKVPLEGENKTIYVRQTETGKKYLEIGAKGADGSGAPGENNIAEFILPTVITDGVFVAEFYAKPASTNPERGNGKAARDLCRLSGYTVCNMTQGDIRGDNAKNSSNNPDNGNFIVGASTQNADGFNEIKVVAQKMADGNYKALVYDMQNPSMAPFESIPKKDMGVGGIASVMLAHIYPQDRDGGADLDDLSLLAGFKLYTQTDPSVLHVGGYNSAARTIQLVMNDDLEQSSINASAVTVTNDSSGMPIGCTPAYDSATRTLTLTLAAEPAEGDTYTVSFNGVKNTSGSEVVKSTSFIAVDGITVNGTANFTNQDDENISDLEGATAVTATFPVVNSAAGNTCTAVLALYDETGALAAKEIKTIAPPAGESDASITLENIAPAQGYTLKLLVWDGFTNLAPLYKGAPLPFQNL